MNPSYANNSLFTFPDPDDYRRLFNLLEDLGYTDANIVKVLGVKELSEIHNSDVPLLLHRTKGAGALNTMIRLFLVEVPCDIEAVQQAIQPIKLETLVHAGLVRIDQSSVSAAVKLMPFQNLKLVFDMARTLLGPLARKYVMGIGRTTLALANLTIRKHSRLTLDLGSGCGIQAFLSAGHSDRIMAVDRNPRAVKLAVFNAKLNGINNVAFLEGSFFEPVEGHQFDLVVTNPPFVISPETQYIFRDSGIPADTVCKQIVREVPEFLTEGGFCQMICNWVEKAGEDWRQRLQSWFQGTGCDAWVMRMETQDTATYASTWIRQIEQYKPKAYTQRLEEWMKYYGEEGIDAISTGFITMRRSNHPPNWFRTDDGPERMLGACGEFVARGFELRDFLESAKDDSQLLDVCLRVSADLRLDRHFGPSNEGWSETSTLLRLARGFAYTGNIDPYVAKMVVACNGQRPLRELLADMVASLGRTTSEVTPHFCMVVRGLIERGFLLPPGIEN